MKEMTLSEPLVRKWIALTDPNTGENPDRGLNTFLKNFLNLSLLWREPLEVILTNGEADSLTNTSYQAYLDDCASGKEVEWNDRKD